MPLDRCPWFIAGPVLGLVIIGLRATVNKPLGALGGYIDVTEHITRRSRLGFSAFLLAGIVSGVQSSVAEENCWPAGISAPLGNSKPGGMTPTTL